MKIEFSMRSVLCERKLDILQRDDVWYYAYVVAGKWNSQRSDVEGEVVGQPLVSKVKKQVARGTQWTFEDKLTVDVSDDVEAVAIKYALYDQDGGETRKKLIQQDKAAVIETKPFKASELIKSAAKLFSGANVVDVLAEVAALLFDKTTGLRGDDLIGTDELCFSLDDPALLDDNETHEEFHFKAQGDLGKRGRYSGTAHCRRIP